MEKKRRDMALRPDFNMGDCFVMFANLNANTKGITSDDVFRCVRDNLDMQVTQDEVFIVFFRVDKDSDSLWSFDEICASFMPREAHYNELV